MNSLPPDKSILGLDIGDARIGLARAGSIAKLPEPLDTLNNDEDFVAKLNSLIVRENIGLIVVGLPRNLNGEETQQSKKIRDFVETLKREVNIDFYFADESLSSHRADKYIKATNNNKIAQDSVAACFILEEFFNTIESAS